MSNHYSDLLSACDTLHEIASPYHFLRERHLQVMWLEQKYFHQLFTCNGEPISVISPGIWNAEAGPDFLKAHLRIGVQEYRGDIEIHLSDDGWHQHHHNVDEKYNHVILHISFWKPKHTKSITTSLGKNIPCTYLEDHLTIPESRILKLIDLDLYPYKHFVGSGACASTIFRSLPQNKIADFFHSAAEWRLMQKRELLKNAFLSPSDYLRGGFAMALGYKRNADSFCKLFLHLKEKNFSHEHDFLAYALGICNFFNQKYQEKWSKSTFYRESFLRFQKINTETIPNITLEIDKIRPANHPVRRIAILIKMLLDRSFDLLLDRLNNLWLTLVSDLNEKTARQTLNKFLEMIPSYSDDYWNLHYTFEEHQQNKSIVLISNDLKTEFIVNVYLPILYHQIIKRNLPEEKLAFHQFYSSLAAPKTKKSDYLAHRFFGDTKKTNLLKKTQIQQGAYQLHKDFCIHYEASCLGCPFIERFRSNFASESQIFTRSLH